MATKNNPGKYDCYANAGPDEPMFVLLGRDKHAPTLVWLWSVLRELDQEDPEKVKEARDCVAAMFTYQKENGRTTIGVGHAAMAAMLELIRAANHAVKEPPNNPSRDVAMRLFLAATQFEEEPAPDARPAGPKEPPRPPGHHPVA